MVQWSDIADYVASNIQDPISRINGVGDIDAMARNIPCVSGWIPTS
jgi:multidrug efflux pump subunit AcrB